MTTTLGIVNRRILVIDDNQAIHADFRKILEGSSGTFQNLAEIESTLFDETPSAPDFGGFEVDCADQGQTGFAMVKRSLQEGRPYGMAFVDMRMPPGWDGVETIEHIWQVDPSVQIVICTAFSDHAWDEVIQRLGMSDQLLILRKPFDTIEVQQLANALTRKWTLAGQVREQMADLEAQVALRTDRLQHMNAELARSNHELDQFASVASHDLQEPLRKIQAFGDRLMAKCHESLDEQGRDYLKRMQGAAGRMQTLIRDILSFSRLTTKAKPFEPVNLNALIQEILSDLEARISETRAAIEVGTLPTIEGDATQLGQLFQNLLANAIKFCKKGEAPMVTISADCLKDGPAHITSVTNGQPKWRISVKDNGIGFEEEYTERIFGIFQRLHGRLEYEGTGIGLAICRKVAEHHGGTITAHSTPGQGTTFLVTLPGKQETIREV
ncbi:MAG: ATP-binding protein [Nitrospirales bacterium]